MKNHPPDQFHTFRFDGRTIAFDELTAEVWSVNGNGAQSKVKIQPQLSAYSDGFAEYSQSKPFYAPKPACRATDPETKMVFFHVTNVCNLSCKYCYVQNIGDDRTTVNTVAEAKTAVESLVRAFPSVKRWRVSFLGGEPTTNMPVVETCVEMFLQAAALVSGTAQFALTTNGILLTPEIADYLATHKFDVVFSLDGPPEIHDKWRVSKGGKPTAMKTLKAIRLVKSRYRYFGLSPENKIHVNATVVPQGINLIDRAAFFFEQGIFNFQFGITVDRLDKKYLFTKEAVSELKDEYTRLYHAGKEVVRRGGFSLVRDNIWTRFTNYYGIFLGDIPCNQTIPCGAGINAISVASDGRVHACPCLHEGKEYEIGNIRGNFDHEKMRSISSSAAADSRFCINCWARHLCGGGCLAYYTPIKSGAAVETLTTENSGRIDDRTEYQPDENVCDLIRHIAHLSISSFVELSEYQSANQ